MTKAELVSQSDSYLCDWLINVHVLENGEINTYINKELGLYTYTNLSVSLCKFVYKIVSNVFVYKRLNYCHVVLPSLKCYLFDY